MLNGFLSFFHPALVFVCGIAALFIFKGIRSAQIFGALSLLTGTLSAMHAIIFILREFYEFDLEFFTTIAILNGFMGIIWLTSLAIMLITIKSHLRNNSIPLSSSLSASFSLYSFLISIASCIAMTIFFILLDSSNNPYRHQGVSFITLAGVSLFTVIFVGSYLATAIFFLYGIYKFQPKNVRRRSVHKTVWYHLIPLFNLYWFFKTINEWLIWAKEAFATHSDNEWYEYIRRFRNTTAVIVTLTLIGWFAAIGIGSHNPATITINISLSLISLYALYLYLKIMFKIKNQSNSEITAKDAIA